MPGEGTAAEPLDCPDHGVVFGAGGAMVSLPMLGEGVGRQSPRGLCDGVAPGVFLERFAGLSLIEAIRHGTPCGRQGPSVGQAGVEGQGQKKPLDPQQRRVAKWIMSQSAERARCGLS